MSGPEKTPTEPIDWADVDASPSTPADPRAGLRQEIAKYLQEARRTVEGVDDLIRQERHAMARMVLTDVDRVLSWLEQALSGSPADSAGSVPESSGGQDQEQPRDVDEREQGQHQEGRGREGGQLGEASEPH